MGTLFIFSHYNASITGFRKFLAKPCFLKVFPPHQFTDQIHFKCSRKRPLSPKVNRNQKSDDNREAAWRKDG